METYNSSLKSWGQNKEGITVIGVNKGMIDVAFSGVGSMFNNPGSDGLHPNAQGYLIMAGNIARAMDYAGRSAGQARKSAAELVIHVHQGGETPAWNGVQDLANAGFSASNVTVSSGGINLGDGAANGWNVSDQFSVSLGNGIFYGTLNINEAYIKWGDTILYSMDTSTNTDSLRMAYVNGNKQEGLKGGYYVWLGDMLIREALSVTSGSGCNGVIIQYDGSGNAILKDLALDGTDSYAPTSVRPRQQGRRVHLHRFQFRSYGRYATGKHHLAGDRLHACQVLE